MNHREKAATRNAEFRSLRSREGGFTMIELITVIIILGVLAVTAIPRFVNLQREARVAKAQAIFAAVSSASNLMHGAARVRSGGNSSAPVEGVTMSNFYPAGSAAGIGAAMTITETEIQYPAVGIVYFVVAPSAGTSATVQECHVAYQEAPANGAPTITLATESC